MTAEGRTSPARHDAAVLDAAPSLAEMMGAIGVAARAAGTRLAQADAARRNHALLAAAAAIRAAAGQITEANDADMAEASARHLSPALLDRLKLDAKRIEAMAAGLETVAALPDPVGRIDEERRRPNGLVIERVRVPIGVIGIIYESRPNVTADAGGLCIKSGNAAILRGGSESLRSSSAIARCLQQGLVAAGLPAQAVQLVPTRDRDAVGLLLGMTQFVDVIVPRGGKSLIERVQADSRIPVIAHLDGICHVYVDRAADPAKARAIALNAKMRRTGVCGAAETLLVDRRVSPEVTQAILADLAAAGCELRGDDAVRALMPSVMPASEEDWSTEYLEAILSVRFVDDVGEAIAHIARYGSHHTDAIVTEDQATADRFLAEVDSAIVLHNASTQFADGGEFGMGAEIGISTGRLPPRGPVGADQLTTYKYVVRGNGQVRP